ncbi:hypothetical protein K466DRAFT_606305 [Polyporus arcularius HHB13444]|uniref:Uncharacterized protein n=1 Tax=Polyporus arcularius HHB13444 TaxID=1314778 RepID=A0A5C3NRM2_9APHY|nr:hypothetical protein K466DRAFT_606305 [Polyporus arcularius HHB13444]
MSSTPIPPGVPDDGLDAASTPSQRAQAAANSDATTAAPQLSPMSYAQVAAIQPSSSNAIVWPQYARVNGSNAAPAPPVLPGEAPALFPPQHAKPTAASTAIVTAILTGAIPPMPATPVLGPVTTGLRGISGSLKLPPPALPLAGNEYMAPPSIPGLRPVEAPLNDIVDPLVLPPPAHAWTGILNMENETLARMSPIQFSSPISIPTTLSATPSHVAQPSQTRGLLATDAGTNNAVDDAYGDFWAQLDTPTITDANLPSALQTPNILTPRRNSSIPASQWPPPNQEAAKTVKKSISDEENFPPTANDPFAHPPVASRFRKKRRGTSPPAGERASKIARRKSKGKKVDRSQPFAHATPCDNPWALPSGSQSSRATLPQSAAMLADSPLPPSSYAPSCQTPYTDFARQASSSASFYSRMNMSGSFPTPHYVSASPSHAGAIASPSPSRSALAESTPLEIQAENAGYVSRLSGPRRPVRFFDPSRPLRAAPGRNGNIRPAKAALREDQQDVHATHDFPSARHTRSVSYRSPTVEEDYEDGEIDDSRRSFNASSAREATMQEEGRHPSLSQPCYSPSPLTCSSAAGQRGRSSRSSRPPATVDIPSPSLYGDDEAPVDEPFSRAPSRMSIIYEQRSNPRLSPDVAPVMQPPPVPRPAHLHPRQATAAPDHPQFLSSGLDVFDVGTDDNMPDAVRRGGASTVTEDSCPTPIPHEGDPEVHHHDPEAHLRGLSDDWIQEVWMDPSGTSITLSTFNPRFTRSYGANRRTASDIRQAISSITGESTFLVIAPDQASMHRGTGPVEWAVTGLTTDGVELLLRRRVWSLKYITFFPRRRTLETPRLLLALEGFLDDNIENIRNAVRSTFERPQIRKRIEQMLRANPEYADIPGDEAFRRIMSSLSISVYTLDNGTIVANVFLRSPTQSIRVWRLWSQELRNITFGSYHTAIARARRITTCAGCSGADHPSHLCPFIRMAGWNGPEVAGGLSYSVDGRERRERRSTPGASTQSTSTSRGGRSGQSEGGTSSTQVSHATRHAPQGSYGDRSGTERGGERGRERGRFQRHEQGGRGDLVDFFYYCRRHSALGDMTLYTNSSSSVYMITHPALPPATALAVLIALRPPPPPPPALPALPALLVGLLGLVLVGVLGLALLAAGLLVAAPRWYSRL